MSKHIKNDLLSSTWLQSLTCHAYRLWCSTLSFSFRNADSLFQIWDAGTPFILALWHDELFASIYAPRRIGNFKLMTMASQSKDGAFITSVLNKLGYKVMRGSSTRGGANGLLNMIHEMQNDKICAALTIDGPKGPRHKAKDGIIILAQKTGAPIIPMRCWLSRKKIFYKSWDQFQLPLLFSKVTICFGKPVFVSEQTDIKDTCHSLEQALNSLSC